MLSAPVLKRKALEYIARNKKAVSDNPALLRELSADLLSGVGAGQVGGLSLEIVREFSVVLASPTQILNFTNAVLYGTFALKPNCSQAPAST
jgi:hypothetical protein